MACLISCETKTPILSGELVELPRPPSLISCLEANVLGAFGVVGVFDTVQYATSSEVFRHLISIDTVSSNGEDAILKYHRRVFNGLTKFGTCDSTWYAFLDNLEINVKGKNRTVSLKDSKFGNGPLANFVAKVYDFNQDGFLDFSFYNDGIAFGRNTFADYYLFDPRQEAYVYSEQLSNLANPSIDENGLFHSYSWSGGKRTACIFRFERSGMLTKIDLRIEDYSSY